jgi:uncharacterized membrane protein
MNKYLYFFICLIIVFVIYIIFDITMITLYVGKQFSQIVKNIQGGRKMIIRLVPAILCFILISFGIVYFVLDKIREDHIIEDSFRYGGVFGAIVYGVFDLTNYSMFVDYNLKIVMIDVIWGTILGSIVSIISKYSIINLVKNQ